MSSALGSSIDLMAHEREVIRRGMEDAGSHLDTQASHTEQRLGPVGHFGDTPMMPGIEFQFFFWRKEWSPNALVARYRKHHLWGDIPVYNVSSKWFFTCSKVTLMVFPEMKLAAFL